MNDRKHPDKLYAVWTDELLTHGEVYVDIDLISQFSQYLRLHYPETWLKTEQEPSVNDDWQARFYIRT